jgi:F0F1-type ATP synthase epsilon subunit
MYADEASDHKEKAEKAYYQAEDALKEANANASNVDLLEEIMNHVMQLEEQAIESI